MIVMVIYMAQMTPDTCRMLGPLSGNPVPFLIPIILTGVLALRNKVHWRKFLSPFLLLSFLWMFAIILKYRDFSTAFLSQNVVLFLYAILIAFIHIDVFGTSYLEVYEDIMVKFAIISLPFWILTTIYPDVASSFFKLFPDIPEHYGDRNFLYIYKWGNSDLRPESSFYSFCRNSGLSWEPGRYAIMLCLALYSTISRRGHKIKDNYNAVVLLVALFTTFSTTGYAIAVVIFSLSIIRFDRIKFKSIFKFVFLILPLVYIFFQFNFLGGKVLNNFKIQEQEEKFYASEGWLDKNSEGHFSLDRFVSMYFESENLIKEPLLGYSRDVKNSWFYKTFDDHYSLTGGLVQVLSNFGIIFGTIIYFFLFRSSFFLSKYYLKTEKITLAIVLIMSSISYVIFCVPVFTGLWLSSAWGPIKIRHFIRHGHHTKQPIC